MGQRQEGGGWSMTVIDAVVLQGACDVVDGLLLCFAGPSKLQRGLLGG